MWIRTLPLVLLASLVLPAGEASHPPLLGEVASGVAVGPSTVKPAQIHVGRLCEGPGYVSVGISDGEPERIEVAVAFGNPLVNCLHETPGSTTVQVHAPGLLELQGAFGETHAVNALQLGGSYREYEVLFLNQWV